MVPTPFPETSTTSPFRARRARSQHHRQSGFSTTAATRPKGVLTPKRPAWRLNFATNEVRCQGNPNFPIISGRKQTFPWQHIKTRKQWQMTRCFHFAGPISYLLSSCKDSRYITEYLQMSCCVTISLIFMVYFRHFKEF